MTTFLLTQHDLPPKTVEAECIHRDADFVRFHDANHGMVYAVQRGLLLAIETLPDASNPDQDTCAVAEPDQTPEPDELPPSYIEVRVDGSAIFEALKRAQRIGRRPLDGS